MKADEQGWKTNNSGILRQLYQNIPKIRKMTQPVVTDALLYKKTKDPHASMVYDYDITAYLRNVKSGKHFLFDFFRLYAI
jgi:hypothetical protein